MTQEETYNGWSNYETWGVALLLDNDEGTYNLVRETAAGIREDIEIDSNVVEKIWTADQAVRFRLADWLEEFVKDLAGVGDDSEGLGIAEPSQMAQQLLGAAISRVDWDEVAGHYVEDQS